MDTQEIDNLTSGYDELGTKIDKLAEVSDLIESDTTLNLNQAMEAHALAPNSDILSIYYRDYGQKQKMTLAVESIKDTIVNSIVAAYKYIVNAIKKLVSFIVKPFSDSKFEYTEKQVTEMRSILGSRELNDAIEGVFEVAKEAGHVLALEDSDQRKIMDTHAGQVPIRMVFDAYKRSLTDSEVDFLTSGHRYKIIKTVIEDFTDNDFPNFVKHMTHDVEVLIDHGLDKAPHVGRGDEVVEEFSHDIEQKMAAIEARYERKTAAIEDMLHVCNSTGEMSVPAHVDLFQKKPSSLFPHIEKLWGTIKFERISAEEKKLIASLNEIRIKYEAEASKIEKRLSGDKLWPAQEAVLKIARKANKEVLQHLSMLVRVSGFIKHSAEVAYRATVKSFGYLTKLLFAIGGLPGVDKDKLMKCMGVIQQKRAAFDRVSAIY